MLHMGILKRSFDYFFGFVDLNGIINGNFDQIQIINANLNKNSLKIVSFHCDCFFELHILIYTLDLSSRLSSQAHPNACVVRGHALSFLVFE